MTWRSSAITAETAARVAVRSPSGPGLGVVLGEPGPQRGPAATPVVVLVVVGQERPVVGPHDQAEHRAGVDRGDRGGQPGQVPVELGHEIGHVGEQRVLVLEERLGRGVGRAHELGQRQVELRRPAGHVVEDGVQPGQPAVDLIVITGRGGLVEGAQVLEDVGEDQPGQVGVADAGREHVLDGGVRAVAELAELVDRLAVPVAGERAGPGCVLEPVQDLIVGQRVQPLAQSHQVVVGRDVLVDGRELGQGDRDVGRVRLHLVHRAEPVKRAQHPQVGEVVIAPGEVEQPEPVADRERVEVQRVASGVAPVLPLLVHLPAQYRGRRALAIAAARTAVKGRRRKPSCP